MTKYKIDYTLKDGRKRRCYVDATPGTPIIALLSKVGICISDVFIKKVSEVKKEGEPNN